MEQNTFHVHKLSRCYSVYPKTALLPGSGDWTIARDMADSILITAVSNLRQHLYHTACAFRIGVHMGSKKYTAYYRLTDPRKGQLSE